MARLLRLTPAQPRAWGTMSPQQMVLHIVDAVEKVLQRRRFAVGKRPPGRFTKIVALYFMRRWPHGVRSGVDPASVAVDPAAFARDVAGAVANLAELAAAPADALAERHPLFGPMSRGDWMRWAYMHTDHHLRQFGL